MTRAVLRYAAMLTTAAAAGLAVAWCLGIWPTAGPQ